MFVILGFGEQGKAILHYLNTQGYSVLTIDVFDYVSKTKLHTHIKTDGSLKQVYEILRDYQNITVINCLPTENIYEVTKFCVDNQISVIDLGGVIEVENRQKELYNLAIENKTTVIRSCGLAPGIVSSFVNFFCGQSEEVNVFCGGIPKYPTYPLGYIKVFNEGGVIKEYTGTAQVIEGGEIINVPTLSQREHLFIPSLGIMEADFTSGGLSTFDNINIDSFDNLYYKTLRYPGHFDYVRNNILIQKKPEQVLREIVEPANEENPDIIVLHIKTTFDEETYFWQYDETNKLSAMSLATGYIAGQVAVEVSEGVGYGVHNMEIFDPYDLRTAIREFDSTECNFSTDPINY